MDWKMSPSTVFRFTTYEAEENGWRFAIRQEINGYRVLAAPGKGYWSDEGHEGSLAAAKRRARSIAQAPPDRRAS